MNIPSKLQSRKLWVAVLTALITVFGEEFGLTPEKIEWIIQLAMFYIPSQAVVDAAKSLPQDKTKDLEKVIEKGFTNGINQLLKKN